MRNVRPVYNDRGQIVGRDDWKAGGPSHRSKKLDAQWFLDHMASCEDWAGREMLAEDLPPLYIGFCMARSLKPFTWLQIARHFSKLTTRQRDWHYPPGEPREKRWFYRIPDRRQAQQ